jgi:hypothetical protein
MPDLELCDISMPIMSGSRCWSGRTRWHPASHIPLVFLTAVTDRDSELRARRLGTDDYVAKPIDFEILHTIINAQIAGIARHEVWPTHIDLNDREIDLLLGWRAARRWRKSRTCSAWPSGRSIFTSTTPVPNSVHAPLTCQRRTLPVAARPVLETNVRSGICVTEDHHAALSQVHLHKDSAAGDRF